MNWPLKGGPGGGPKWEFTSKKCQHNPKKRGGEEQGKTFKKKQKWVEHLRKTSTGYGHIRVGDPTPGGGCWGGTSWLGERTFFWGGMEGKMLIEVFYFARGETGVSVQNVAVAKSGRGRNWAHSPLLAKKKHSRTPPGGGLMQGEKDDISSDRQAGVFFREGCDSRKRRGVYSLLGLREKKKVWQIDNGESVGGQKFGIAREKPREGRAGGLKKGDSATILREMKNRKTGVVLASEVCGFHKGHLQKTKNEG